MRTCDHHLTDLVFKIVKNKFVYAFLYFPLLILKLKIFNRREEGSDEKLNRGIKGGVTFLELTTDEIFKIILLLQDVSASAASTMLFFLVQLL